jgi:hypothetical protein
LSARKGGNRVSTHLVELAAEARLIVSAFRDVRMDVTLRYHTDDPLAVRMAFPAQYSLNDGPPPSTKEIEWVFGRDLLASGLKVRSGAGDIRISPCPGVYQSVVVELMSPGGVALLMFKDAELREFLGRTYERVPKGQEYCTITVDHEIEELLRCR